MARQRIIKPDFYTDEDLAGCSAYARLLFPGLWMLADKRGRLKDRPVVIKGAIFPYEPEVDIDALLVELVNAGSIIRYEVDGYLYIQIPAFEKHQRPHPKEADSVIPAPPVSSRKAAKLNCTAAKSLERGGGLPVVPSFLRSSAPSESIPSDVAAPAALAPTKRPKAWSVEACDDWIAAYHGTAPGGRIGKALAPLVKAEGWGSVRTAWRNYLAQTEAEFASAQRFAATYGRWSGSVPGTPPRGAKSTVADRTQANLETWIASKEEP